MAMDVERVSEMPRDALEALVVESEHAGVGFVRRLAERQRPSSRVRIVAEMCGVVDECDFFYMPDPTLVRRPKTRFGHLGGSWYAVF